MKKIGKMMRQVVESALHKPATVLYPAVKVKMPDRFRGKLVFYPDRCICCKLCMRDCPTGAIEIRKVGDKQFEADIDLAKCIYCAQCVDVCPKKALEATGDFELAQLEHGKLRVTYKADPKAAPAKPAGPSPEAEPTEKP